MADLTPYRTEAPEVPKRREPSTPWWLAVLADRRWFRRLVGGRWELWWSGAWPIAYITIPAPQHHRWPTGGYYRWVRVGEWNLPAELRPWPRFRRIDRFPVEQVGFWAGLGDVTIAREDWTR